MKKALLTLAVALASVATYAQHSVGSISLQPKVGVNIASLTENPGGDPRWGFVAGAEMEYQATDIFSISGGLLYSMQGAKNGDTTYKLDYINIPILANFYVAKGLAVKFGLQPAFNVNSKKSGKYYAGIKTTADVDAKDVEFSIPVGLSYEFPSSPLVLEGRYNWGVTKIADWSDYKNSVFQITLGYKFDL